MIQARDQASAVMSKVGNATDTLRSKAGRLAKSGFSAVASASKVMVTGLMIGIPIISGLIGGMAVKAGVAQAEVQTMGIALETAMGGNISLAKEAQKNIIDFATKTPFALGEVQTAFIKLKNMGLDPSNKALTSYGDTASAMGKSLNQMVEAVADAATGEFERLKEFGIRSSSEGDRVSFTFKGITTTVGKNAAEIEGYLQELGATNFAGGMEKQSKSMAGLFSTLADTVNLKLASAFDRLGGTTAVTELFTRLIPLIDSIDVDALALKLERLFLKFQESQSIQDFLTNTWSVLVTSFDYFQSDVLPFVIESLIILEDWFTVNGPIIQEFVEGTWTDLINGFNDMSQWISDNRTALENFGLIILGFALGFGLVALAVKIYLGVLAAYAFMTGVVTVVTAGFGVALAVATSPLFLIALAIGAVIVIGLLLWRHWGFLSAKAREVFAAIGSFIGMIVKTVVRDFQTFQNKAANIATAITRSFNNIKSGVGNALKGTVNELIRNLNNATAGVNGIIRNIPSLPGLGKIPEIPRIPSFRKGVTNFEGGLAYVHQGEVLMNLAKGTDVITASQTRNMMSTGGGQPNNNLPSSQAPIINITVGSYLGTERDKRVFADDMAAAIAEALKKLETE